MRIQNTITTVVDPIVSILVGNEIFLISPRTSAKNSPTDARTRLNMPPFPAQPQPHDTPSQPKTTPTFRLAGAPGFEPGPSVLETDMLAVDTMPLLHTTRRRPLPAPASREGEGQPISLLCAECVFGRTCSISSAPADLDRSSCSSSSNNFDACTQCRPNQ